jgi:hypothetical protein
LEVSEKTNSSDLLNAVEEYLVRDHGLAADDFAAAEVQGFALPALLALQVIMIIVSSVVLVAMKVAALGPCIALLLLLLLLSP